MTSVPCPLCGYEAPGPGCPHCGLRATDPSLASPPADAITAVFDGLRAVPTGLYLLLTTRGVKRLLLPPVVLTAALFVWLFWLMWSFVIGLVDAARLGDASALDMDSGWMRTAAEWLITKGVVVFAAKSAGWLVILLAGFFLMWWVGSIVYEAIAGPFLDEVQGRLEAKWFGRNPRDEIERPTDLPVARCAMLSVVAGVPAFLCLVLWWLASGVAAWFFLLLAPLPFVALGLLVREYGVWLAWVVKVEGRTLLVSLKASLVAALILVPAFVIKFFVPFVGDVLFAVLAGFATALTLLDIPFSRRQWPLAARVNFLVRNFPAMTGFGAVAGLLFAIPLLGPILMVPAASVGGLWLVCRLDKNPLRPAGNRIQRPPAA